MNKIKQAVAQSIANKLNKNQLLEITREAVKLLGLPNKLEAKGCKTLNIDKELQRCSTIFEKKKQEQLIDGYKFNSISKNGYYIMSSPISKCICIRFNTSYSNFKQVIFKIDQYLNINKGNLEITDAGYVKLSRQSNDLTRKFNKLLRDTILEKYPEVAI